MAPVRDSNPMVPAESVSLLVEGMTCGACSSTVEQGLLQHKGVLEAAVSLMTNKAAIKYDASTTHPRDLIETIECLGFDAVLDLEKNFEKDLKKKGGYVGTLALAITCLTLAVSSNVFEIHSTSAAMALQGRYVGQISYHSILFVSLATPVQFFSGWKFHVDALKGLQHLNVGMSFLISAGTSTSYFYALTSLYRAGASTAVLDKHDLNPQIMGTYFFLFIARTLLTIAAVALHRWFDDWHDANHIYAHWQTDGGNGKTANKWCPYETSSAPAKPGHLARNV
jgi:cation transport ATPase